MNDLFQNTSLLVQCDINLKIKFLSMSKNINFITYIETFTTVLL